ncbi:MAG TPA: DUF3488 and transglutaminase-like domain-containing protein [Actinomycetota bacterium]|nr:DUF3488 and transglutaminase-like domain-containing protein [Actinomycetota bacterium]
MTTAVAFGRVFDGVGATLRLAAAGGAAVLLATLLERRGVLVSALASAAGLALALGLLVFPETTWYGLPTRGTFQAAALVWERVGRDAASEVAPAPPLDSLLVAGLTAVWTAAYAAHVLAVRARSPLLALVPGGALVGFASLVMNDGARPGYVGPVLASALLLLFADALQRVHQWGPITVWRGIRRGAPRLPALAGARPAQRLALVSLAVALLAPGVLPGFRAQGVLHLRGAGVGPARVGIDPLVDIRPQLLQNPEVPLFSVQADRPAYWRTLSADVFTGRFWLPSERDPSGWPEVGSGVLPGARRDGQRLRQRFVLDRLAQPYLPAAYEPVAVDLPGVLARYDPDSGTLAVERTGAGFAYEVESAVVVPTPEQLEAATIPASPEVEFYTALPDGIPREVYDLAQEITEDETTPYGKALALQRYLRTFRYDETVRPGHGVDDLLYFLTELKAGYCEQFAGAMAVLLRALGIPARVAVGFTPGTLDPRSGRYVVTTKNLHAWVEVLFPQFGWLAFEPTPTRANPVAQPYLFPVRPGAGAGSGPECPLRPGMDPDAGCQGGRRTPAPSVQPPREPPSVPAGESGSDRTEEPLPPLRFLVGLGLVLALLLSIPLVRLGRRRLAVRRARAPRERVLAAFRYLTQHAGDVGFGRRPSETVLEYRDRLRRSVRFSDGHLERVTALVTVAAYTDRPLSSADAEAAVAAARAAARDIVRSVDVGRRLAGLYRPGGDGRRTSRPG